MTPFSSRAVRLPETKRRFYSPCARAPLAMLSLLTPQPRSSLADGNVGAGQGVVQQIAVSKLTTGTAPTEADAAWTYLQTDHYTFKSARGLTDGSVIALCWSEVGGYASQASLVYLSSTGSVIWGVIGYGTKHGEGTDVRRAESTVSNARCQRCNS